MTDSLCFASTPSSDNATLSLLFNNIDLLLKNIETIKNNPENYYIQIPGTGITGIYIGFYRLYLGDLLQLWNSNSTWIKRYGARKKYIYHLGGFPTCGICFLSFFNAQTGEIKEERKKTFYPLFSRCRSTV